MATAISSDSNLVTASVRARRVTAEYGPVSPVTAMSSDGDCIVVNDGDVVRVAGGRALMNAAGVIAGAVVEQAVWLVTRGVGGHELHRFHPSGAPVAPPVALGDLGDGATIDVNRIGARIALIEGERAVLVKERDGGLAIEELGARRRDRRVLVGARGVAERSGTMVKLRSGVVPALELPVDLCGHVLGAAAVVHDGNALLVELVGADVATALVYDLRHGQIRKRIRLGELRVLAIAERAGLVVLGRGAHVALLDLRAGQCVSERIMGAPATSAAIDAAATRLVIVDVEGNVTQLGRAMTDIAGGAPAAQAPRAQPQSQPQPEPEPQLQPDHEPEPLPEPPAQAAPLPASRPVRDQVESANDNTGGATDDRADLAELGTLHLGALGEPLAHAPLAGAELAAYLRDARAWIESLCTTAVALTRGDEALIAEARKRERDDADKLQRWNQRGAPHVEVARELGASALAGTVLLLVAAPQIWGELAKSYGACTGEPHRPLVDELLLAHLLEAETATRTSIAGELDEDSLLVRSGAVTVGHGVRPYAALAAHPAIARRLAGVVPPVPETALELADVVGPREALANLVRALVEPCETPMRVVIRGRRGAGRRTVAAVLGAQAGRALVVVETGDLDTLLARLQAVALRGQVACLDLDEAPDEPGSRGRLRTIIDDYAAPLFVRGPRDGELPLAPGFELLELPSLSETERRDVWRTQLDAHGLDAELAAALASRVAVGPGSIARACAAVVGRAHRDVPAALIAALRQLRSARIAGVAERIDDVATFEELVVPADIEDALRELVARVKHRRTVLETWGLSRVASTARGITALFQGGPGTGKTMAAGVIANALGFELWRVDLSKIVSKWIGETEKNLAAVFDAAEEGEIVLLFDEADSLFSRRSDPKSGNDKHANVATNYLLQRLDSFSGMAVLTTNFGTAIDPAFKRRMSVHVQFPFPDEDDRERLWRAHLPASVPVAPDVDAELGALARQYQLAGGYIRNAVLRAAYLAADRGAAISADHLRRAVQLEKERVGKLGNGRFD